jgi:UDP-N-acetylglucosamine--N-acetylmuramyl-(pentapeptide) pyrophosphoryl-undecaprenol N-acetylglucosamine transferase
MDEKKMIITVTGGGTGGHIYPAVAVAQVLKANKNVQKVYYIGCPDNMEKEIADKDGLEFIAVYISGMPRKLNLGLFKWFYMLIRAVGDSLIHLKKIKPDVILGTGGYVSAPVLIAAVILKIPFVLHDPDANPGLVNRLMSPWSKAVSLAFEEAKKHINSKNIVVNGNPVRSSISSIDKETALKSLNLDPNRKTILVMGGSQGAKTINHAIAGAAQDLINIHNLQIIHQTGKRNYDEHIEYISQQWTDFSNNPYYIVRPYFENISIPLAAADLAVSRAGSLSISELNLSGLPSILVPYPYAAADHQRYNARAMLNAGASIYQEDADCNSQNLSKLIIENIENIIKLDCMKIANQKLAKPKAGENLANIIINLMTCYF